MLELCVYLLVMSATSFRPLMEIGLIQCTPIDCYSHPTQTTYIVAECSFKDFYAGMFKKNDFLVAQDRLYKERIPFRYMYAKYGRYFKCPITYFRVVDRLGVGRGPQVEVIRGGIRYKYMVLRLKSGYNLPISVNIYVGCENKMPRTKATTSTLIKANVTTSLDVGNSTAGDSKSIMSNGTATEVTSVNATKIMTTAAPTNTTIKPT